MSSSNPFKKTMPDFDLREELLAILRQKPNANQEIIDSILSSLPIDREMSAHHVGIIKSLLQQFSIETDEQLGHYLFTEAASNEE
jgi:hypothetical protein